MALTKTQAERSNTLAKAQADRKREKAADNARRKAELKEKREVVVEEIAKLAESRKELPPTERNTLGEQIKQKAEELKNIDLEILGLV